MILRYVAVKPECLIRQTEDDGQLLLTCEAMGNPGDLVFGWTKGNDSMTLTGFTVDGMISTFALDAHEDSFGTYFCHANNSMGPGYPCEIDVQGSNRLKS